MPKRSTTKRQKRKQIPTKLVLNPNLILLAKILSFSLCEAISLFKKMLKTEYRKGQKAARKFLKTNPSIEQFTCNYGTARNDLTFHNKDQFALGYLSVLKKVREKKLNKDFLSDLKQIGE